MYLRKLSAPALHRVTVDSFPGLDRRARAASGTFARMENLCADGYPAAQVRPRRGRVTTLSLPGGLTAKEALIWVDGHTLYVGGHATGVVLREGDKQFVSMGAYLVIFPDKVWINLRQLEDFGHLDNTVTAAGEVAFSLCRGDGSAWGAYTVSAEAPAQAEDGTLWLDISGTQPVLRRCGDGLWTEAADVCVRVQCPGIGAGFREGDGVEVTGCEEQQLNGVHILRCVENDMLVIGGTVAGERVQQGGVTVSRSVPEMDYVTECGNRLWGCKYGVVNGRAVNEVYASKLGDFRNWNCYAGLSTDSYAASRGSDGPFTAAASYLGSVLFFKENCIERLYPSAVGAHQMVTLECPGVLPGCHKSVAAADGTLYYLGRGGVYAFDGSLPVTVSAALEGLSLTGGCAGVWQGRYYLGALDGEERHLLVYDTRRGLWHREDKTAVADFAVWNGELYALTEDGAVLALHGQEGEKESSLFWLAETGELGLDTAEHKYPQRLTLRLSLEKGGTAQAALSYDGGLTWYSQGGIVGRGGADAVTLHLRPRRCAQVRLRLQGQGACTLYALSAVYGKGSDET